MTRHPANLSAVSVPTEPQVSDKIGKLNLGQEYPAQQCAGSSGEAREGMTKYQTVSKSSTERYNTDSRGGAQKLQFQCPACREWIAILPTTNAEDFKCPWCNERLRLAEDDDPFRDDSKLVTFRSHWDEEVT